MSKVVKQLNKLQADAHALFIAFHDYHWNVKGLQFAQVHAYTEEAYDEMGDLFDELAESALLIGGKAMTKTKDLIELSKDAPVSVKDGYGVIEVLENVKKAYEYLVKEFKKLQEIAEAEGDDTTSNIAQDHYGEYEKRLWMLASMLSK